MPPKREAGAPSTSPPVKMIKIGTDGQEYGCDPVESRYRLTEEGSYSPYPNNEPNEHTDFDEENITSSGLRTDTISLLMKIEQLQAQLKYERRCRILAERELRELKEMNTLMMQMRHTAHELRVTLDHVLQGNEPTVTQPNAQDESMSFLSEPDADMRPVHTMPTVHNMSGVHSLPVHDIPEDDDSYLYLAENIRVPKNLYERIAEIEDYKKYTGALLMMLFDRETLATHSLQGRRGTLSGSDDSQKPQLPPEILRNIIEHISRKFGVDHGLIKTAIRTKLNNEDKLFKKRHGLCKSDNKVVPIFCPEILAKSEPKEVPTFLPLLPENADIGGDSQQ